MSAFHRKRDEASLPGYQITLAATRLTDRDGGPHRLDLVRAAATSPHSGRVILEALPDLMSQALDADQLARAALISRLYRPTEQPAAH